MTEDWFRDPMPTQPQAPTATVLYQSTLDKVAKINRLESALRKEKGFGSYELDLEGLLDGPKTKLPAKFKMPDIAKFDGTRNPKSHVCAVNNTLQPMGMSAEQIAVLFPRTLTGAVLDWYLILEPAITQDWDATIRAFRE